MGVLFIVNYFLEKGIKGDDVVVVLLDYGGVIWVCKLVEFLKFLIVIIDKCCLKVNVVEVMNIIG